LGSCHKCKDFEITCVWYFSTMKLRALLSLHPIYKHIKRSLHIGKAFNEWCLKLRVTGRLPTKFCHQCHLPASPIRIREAYKKLMQS
jgi:hypothetical protein